MEAVSHDVAQTGRDHGWRPSERLVEGAAPRSISATGVNRSERQMLPPASDIQIILAAVDMWCPEGDAFRNLRDDLPVIRLAFLEAEFKTDLVVHGAAC